MIIVVGTIAAIATTVCLTTPQESIDGATTEGWTPLLFAAQAGHMDVVVLLLTRGADAQLRTNNLRSIVHVAHPSIRLEIEAQLRKRYMAVPSFDRSHDEV